MKCPICKTGQTKESTTTVTLEKKGSTLVFRLVPAAVCPNCGEAFIDGGITEQMMSAAEKAIHEGVKIDVREYKAA